MILFCRATITFANNYSRNYKEVTNPWPKLYLHSCFDLYKRLWCYCLLLCPNLMTWTYSKTLFKTHSSACYLNPTFPFFIDNKLWGARPFINTVNELSTRTWLLQKMCLFFSQTIGPNSRMSKWCNLGIAWTVMLLTYANIWGVLLTRRW